MATDESSNSLNRSSSLPRESPANESFVKKVSSRVSGIIPSISKWFSREENKSTIRYRDEEDDDDDDEDQSFRIQPPSKKLKLPPATTEQPPAFKYNNFSLSSLSTPMVVEESRQERFVEPIAGPSGVKSRKLILSSSREHSVRNDMVNGDNNSDSGDSTSGYSSMARIGSKEQIGQHVQQPKGDAGESLLFDSTSPPRSEENTRSLFHERSFTPRSNSSLSSRRPSFSASNFGSPTFIDRTISTQRVLNSPFYNGRTIYGGASAYGRKLGRSSSELRSNLNHSVEVKPKTSGNNESMVLSKTARRILDTLEQYTTPVNDAKKIPIVVNKRHVRQEGLLTKFIGANPYTRDNKVASNTELHVPTVPELLRMKQQLQESTEAVRQIATHSKSNLNKEEYKLPIAVEEEATKHTSKIKTKVCAVRQKTSQVTDTVEAVKLPAISLPISTLPKFDFSVPPPTAFPISKEPPTQHNKTETKLPPKTNPTTEFKFSDPLVITENIETVIGVNNFKFSEPISKKQLKNNFKINDTVEFKPKRVQKNNGEIQPAAQLVSGSVMEILGKFVKPQQEGTWECKSCWVRNQPDKTKCVACETAKVAPSQPTTTNLLEKFKPQAGTWECTSCLVRNQPDKTKCVACETAKVAPSQPTTTNLLEKFKPAEGTWECESCLVRNQPDKTKCVACEAPSTKKQSLAEKFKPAEGTWECPICMIRNKSDVTRCVACESPRTAPPPKPQIQPQTTPLNIAYDQWQCSKCKLYNKRDTTSCLSCKTAKVSFGFGEQFKPPKETWECTSCMVRNQKNAEKCVACESFSPEMQKKSSSGFGVQFKKKESEWECDSCMVKNAADKTKCVCCEAAKPGSKNLDDKKSGFTKFSFGVDKQAASKFMFGIQPTSNVTAPLPQQQNNTSNSFVFGGTTKPAVSVAPKTFSFGITQKTTQAENKETPQTQPPTFAVPPIKPKETETTQKPPEKASTETPKPIVATLPSVPSNLFSTTKPENTTTKPLFQPPNSETKPSPSNTFAAPVTTQASKSFSFAVGAASSSSKTQSSDEPPPAKIPAFSFAPKTDEKPKENAVVTQSSSTVGSFSFGSENKAPTFQFNAPTTISGAAHPTQNGFSFGGGTTNSTAAGGFSFGKVAAPTAGGFSFGSNGNAQPPAAGTSGGFNFSATAPPAFNPDVQPTFNFSSGSPISFSAQASTNGTALPQRKYKRALRRANR